jgi:hypothetical protein
LFSFHLVEKYYQMMASSVINQIRNKQNQNWYFFFTLIFSFVSEVSVSIDGNLYEISDGIKNR